MFCPLIKNECRGDCAWLNGIIDEEEVKWLVCSVSLKAEPGDVVVMNSIQPNDEAVCEWKPVYDNDKQWTGNYTTSCNNLMCGMPNGDYRYCCPECGKRVRLV